LGCGQEGAGEGGRNDPNTVNKWKKKDKFQKCNANEDDVYDIKTILFIIVILLMKLIHYYSYLTSKLFSEWKKKPR
jgi:hypothetical protein